MLTLPAERIALLVLFAPEFSPSVWLSAQVLLVGAILSAHKRTVTAALRAMGLLDRRCLSLKTGEITTERVYGLLSLISQQLDFDTVLTRWRDHWHSEHSEHGVRDVVFAEDACRVHQAACPQVLAALRNAVITIAHQLGFSSLTTARRYFALNLKDALAYVGVSLE